ncbi:hypothetical protein AB0D14_18550 [Streptomyces sp. NPDC048484]|uniref:hypothetical protein n=1 Tax=Streptomyces sp. NPDC048484 TaxID=3155146 RepID=UPI00342DF679
MLRTPEADAALSAECALAGRPGDEDLHRRCRQTSNVPLPGAMGLLLMSPCPCSCHVPGMGGGAR